MSDPYKEQAHEVRWVGNDAAHTDEVTFDEVEDLLHFTGQVLKQLYVLPEQLRKSKERREAKKSEQR